MKVLMFGGAFNPPTIAHIDLAHQVQQKLHFDKVIFVPSKMDYIANIQQKDFAYDNATRYQMLQAIARNNPWMEVSDYELNSDFQPRTYKTLQYLKSLGYTPSLLFGSDKLSELETGWKHVSELCQEFGIVCMQRNGEDCQKIIHDNPFLQKLSPYITLVQTDTRYQTISSSLIRKALANGNYEAVKAYIPEEITTILKEQ